MFTRWEKIKHWTKAKYWDIRSKEWVTTLNGVELTDTLEKKTGVHEDERAKAEWVEYWKDGTLVHRSVNIALKQSINLGGAAGNLGI